MNHLLKENRLKQDEVDAACVAIMQRGERISTNTVHKEVGERGSFSTIQKMIKDWQTRNPEQSEQVNTLPVVVDIPEALKTAGNNALKAFWQQAMEIAQNELKTQQEALKRAEDEVNLKMAELQEFSDNQADTIEALREQLAQRDAERDQLKAEFESRLKTSEERAKSLDVQVTKLQTALDIQAKQIAEAKAERAAAIAAEKIAIEKAAALSGQLQFVLEENKNLQAKIKLYEKPAK